MARTQTFSDGELGLSIRSKINSLPDWAGTYSYNINDITHYNGYIYSSLTDNNINNLPDVTVSQWKNVINYTSSLFGTSSWAINVVNGGGTGVVSGGSYNISASWASASISSSYASNAVNAFPSIGRPEMYGAVGDGVTDDWIAIKNCTLSHSVIEFDAKTYAVRGMLPVPSNTTFKGKGMGRTTLKIMDNSPYGYDYYFSMFTIALLPDNIRWLPGSGSNFIPIGTECGSGSTDYSKFDGLDGFGNQTQINPGNNRWVMNANSQSSIIDSDWLELCTFPWGGIPSMRRNVLFCDMTIDGNFDNQAKHSSYNWKGWAKDANSSGSGWGYYLPQYANKVRSTTDLFNLAGENIIFDHIEARGFGCGVSYGYYSSSINVPDVDGAYIEGFIFGAGLSPGLQYDVSHGVENCPYVSSFRDTTTFPWPVTAQTTFKPNRALNCIATNPGNPDYQNPGANQTVFAIAPMLAVKDIDGNVVGESTVELLSSVENCTVAYLYPRCPSTASIWNGSILSIFVSSSCTYENLTGSSDGIIPGNGYKTGSIGQWAIVNIRYLPDNRIVGGRMKKINDGTPYGRWEMKSGLFEYAAFFGGASVTKNNYAAGMDSCIGQDTWQYSRIIDGNSFIDIANCIPAYGGSAICSMDKYIISNNYIQILDRDLSDDLYGNQGTLNAIIVGSNQSTDILHKHKSGEIVIQNNTIRIPAASSRYTQEYYPSINAIVGANAPWELQNFLGSINGNIIGHNIANISIVTASLSTRTNGYITASFTSSIAHGLAGSITVHIANSISPYSYLNTAPSYNELPGVSILEVPTTTTFKCLIPASISDAYGVTISGSNVSSMVIYNAYFSGSYNRSFSQFSGDAYSNCVAVGSAFFDRIHNIFQRAINNTYYAQYKDSNTQRCNGIVFKSISTYTSASHLTIEGNTFINFNSSKRKGFNYNYNANELQDAYANWFNNIPIMFQTDSDIYPTSSEHQFDLTKYTDLVSSYCIENNYDDAGTPTPLVLLLPAYFHTNRDGFYNIPNYSKNNLALERNSIITPNIDINKNILSKPALTYWIDSAYNSSGGTNGPVSFNYSTSLVQYSSSFTNQLQPNKTYIFNYMFNQEGNSAPIVFSPALTDAKVKIGGVPLFTWNNAIHNTGGDHRIYFTTNGSLINPTGSFSMEFSQSAGASTGNFSKVSIFEYYPTASINFNIKNHIINLDDNLCILNFSNTGSYIVGTYADVNNTIGQNIIPRNEEINIRTVQTVPNTYYNVTWPSNINWLKNPSITLSSSIVNYKIRSDKGQLYGTYDVEIWSTSGNDIYFNTGRVEASKITVTNMFQLPYSSSTSVLTPITLTGSAYVNVGNKCLYIYTGTTWMSSSMV